jgi:penicillin-binding protein 2
MGDREGAMVALDPHTGEVLAMVSRPTFDPNAFAVRIGREEWNKLITDPDHPLLNKAIQAQSPPGSTFKVIMSVAGLQENVAQNFKVNCQGGATIYGHFYACDKHHGEVDIEHALPWSCDTYYYMLAARLGIDTIARYAHELGLGQKTGIDLPDEIAGVMPSTEWALKEYHRKWYAGETVSVGIGQGAVAATPIQLARALGGIASGGVLKRPHVVFPDELPAEYRSAMRDSFPGSGDVTIPINPENWEIITDGMAATTTSGTAFASHLEGIDFAGKTGTAQVVNHSAGVKSVSSIKAERANAWFVGMAPRRNPDIVVAVFWQHGGWGAGSAHLVAKVIQAFVDKQRRLNNNLVAEKPQQVEVGAVWSGPDNPGGLGGKPIVAHARKGDELASAYAGHYFLSLPREAKSEAVKADALAAAVR